MTPAIIRLVHARVLLRQPSSVGLLGFVRSRLQPTSVMAAAITRLARVRRMVGILSRTVGWDPLVSGRMGHHPTSTDTKNWRIRGNGAATVERFTCGSP